MKVIFNEKIINPFDDMALVEKLYTKLINNVRQVSLIHGLGFQHG